MSLVAFLGFLSIGAAEPVRYPIPPQPLRKLYVEADLVVVAKAGKTKDLDRNGDHRYSASVMLSVEKTVKGHPKATGVIVFFAKDMICPASDRYPEDKTVLAFLSWDKKVNAYRARGLSYGSKELSPEGLAVYLARLEELSKMPEKEQKDPNSAETVEWLVRCMEHSATRWEGAYEFDVLDYGIHRRGESLPVPVPTSKLTAEHRKRLIGALLKRSEVSEDDLTLTSVLSDVADPRIDKLLAKGIRISLDAGNIQRSQMIAEALAARLRSDKAAALVKRSGFSYERDDEARKAVLEEFLKLVGE